MKNYNKIEDFVNSLETYELSVLKYAYYRRLDNDIVKLYEKYKDNDGIVELPNTIDIYSDIDSTIDKIWEKDIATLKIIGFKLNYFMGENDKSNYMIDSVYNNGASSMMRDGIKLKIIEMFADKEAIEKARKKATDGCYFNNEDIIITDPCYIFNDKQYDKSNGYLNLENIGIKNYISHSTLYGDWSCTTFNTDTNKEIGQFCADAGMVCVAPLNKVTSLSDEYNNIKDKEWTRTIIKGFTGHVYVDFKTDGGIYDEDTPYHNKGDKWTYDYIEIVGEGNINFRTKQTGL